MYFGYLYSTTSSVVRYPLPYTKSSQFSSDSGLVLPTFNDPRLIFSGPVIPVILVQLKNVLLAHSHRSQNMFDSYVEEYNG